jgi:hypothetical protein
MPKCSFCSKLFLPDNKNNQISHCASCKLFVCPSCLSPLTVCQHFDEEETLGNKDAKKGNGMILRLSRNLKPQIEKHVSSLLCCLCKDRIVENDVRTRCNLYEKDWI